MEQGKTNTEENLSSEEKANGISHSSCERNPVKPFAEADKGMHSDHSEKKENNSKFSVAQHTGARCNDVKRKLAEEKMAHSSCHQMVPETERELESSKINVNSQESSCNSSESKIGQGIQTPVKGTFHLKSEDLDLFRMVPTIVCIDDSPKPFDPMEPRLVRLIDPAVVECLEELIDKVAAVESLLSLKEIQQSPKQQSLKASCKRNYEPAPPHVTNILQIEFLENLSGPSSQEIANNHPGKKPKIDEDSRKPLLSYQRTKLRKDFEMLSAILDEVGRMNEYFRKEMINKNKKVKFISNTATYMHENLQGMGDLPSYDIFVESEKCVLNVHQFGSAVFVDCIKLLASMRQFVMEYDKFRLKFLYFSETFSLNPLEELIDSRQKDDFDKFIELSKTVYKAFFGDEKYDSQYKQLKNDHSILKHNVRQFDSYLDKLTELYN